ncbi:hypothetical protein NQ317_018093 [Molorchus minor]|uniref:SWIM-type domain-containing protein n=1 Tax=Molorchus minor TaxID=1323400 RepID=A0ABQ9JE27_9CUCU|nr:hypothetical protein NQ317_018093 [Molorchus minor]
METAVTDGATRATSSWSFFNMRLLLEDYFSYLNASFSSRNVKEGEEVLNANHIILCGKTKSTDNEIYIQALCLQTSALNSQPHSITGILINNGEKITIRRMVCTCKAGAGERCKHISAVLLYCTRYDVMELEPVSATDLKCVWSQKKQSALEQYKAVPLMETDCLKEQGSGNIVVENLSTEDADNLRLQFETCVPHSALMKHRNAYWACKKENKDLHFFRFPLDEHIGSCEQITMGYIFCRCRLWIDMCDRPDLLNKDITFWE